MNALIIGGSGFIGPHVARSLRSAGTSVAVLQRSPDLGATDVVSGNRNDVGAIRHIISSRRIDTVIDLLAYAEATTVPLLDALEGTIKRYVMISSCDVYSNYEGLLRLDRPPIIEATEEDGPLRRRRFPHKGDTPRPPTDPEAWLDTYDKIPIEEAVKRRTGMEWCILRLPVVFGPGDRQRRFGWLIRPMMDKRPAVFVGRDRAAWRRTYGYVEDVGHAIALAATHPAASRQTYNVGYEDHPTEREWIARFAEHLGWTGQLVETAGPSPGESAIRSANLDLRYPLVISTRKHSIDFGYAEPTELWSALDRTIEDEMRQPRPSHLDQQYFAEDALLKALR